jgi:hypothetical protein
MTDVCAFLCFFGWLATSLTRLQVTACRYFNHRPFAGITHGLGNQFGFGEQVLHPLQAAMVYKAFSPRPPNTLLMLEELRNRHSARISKDVALWSRERDSERPWSGTSTSPVTFQTARIGEIRSAPCGRHDLHNGTPPCGRQEVHKSTAPCGRQEMHTSRSLKYLPLD